MEQITSGSILESLRKRSDAKLEEQQRKINTFAMDLLRNTEAITALIFLTGELHIDLKKNLEYDKLIHDLYATDPRLSSRLNFCIDADKLAMAQGNAHIQHKSDETEESVCIICTYRFDRDMLVPKLLAQVADVAKQISAYYGTFDLINVYGDPFRDRQDNIPKWGINIESRDNSIIVTLSEGKNK